MDDSELILNHPLFFGKLKKMTCIKKIQNTTHTNDKTMTCLKKIQNTEVLV